ncbi:MAG: N-acetyltransferase [Candidatus Ozemobacteraceae bacterium]
MSIIIRPEVEADFFETEMITREAFWDKYKPGCDEHLVLHQLRKSEAFIPELDYVAIDDSKIVGNIVYSKATVKNMAAENTVLCMGPLSVLPSFQKRGIGSLLMRKTIEKAIFLNYSAIVIFGNPQYYMKFGFVNAEQHGIQTSDGHNFDAFMTLVLSTDLMKGIAGRFFEDKAFQIKNEDLEMFEKYFPFKEKHVREGQLK